MPHLKAVVISDFLVQALDLLHKVLGALLHDLCLDVAPQGAAPHLQAPACRVLTWTLVAASTYT